MLRYLEKITSLKNLGHNSAKGQIVTLLMLMMVGVLILVMITVNLGNVSTTATNLSNAADSAALYLASQLATKSHQLYKALGDDTKKCKKGGFFALFLAIVVAIIAVVVTIVTMGTTWAAAHLAIMMVIGAGAGAVGGAVGGAIAGTGVLQGAVMGAAVGAAIGGAASGIAGMMAPTTSSTAVTVTGIQLPASVIQGTVLESTAFTVAAGPAGIAVGSVGAGSAGAIAAASGIAVAGVGAGAASGGAIATAGAGQAVMGTLGVASKVYNTYVDQQMSQAAISAAAKSINGLLEYDRYRENVFFQALSQTVDDPTKTDSVCVDNKECDPHDSDGDGDTDEKVPYFQYWWDVRVLALKKIIPDLKNRTYDLLYDDVAYKGCSSYGDSKKCSLVPRGKDKKVPMDNFRETSQEQYSQTYTCSYSGSQFSTGYGNTSCSSPCYAVNTADETNVYRYGNGCMDFIPGPLFRAGLKDWKSYVRCSDDYKESGYCESGWKDGVSEDQVSDNGVVVAVADAMESAGVKLSFYKRNMPSNERNSYGEDCEDGDCEGDMYWDEVEAVTGTLMGFVETVKAIRSQGIDKATSTWQTWFKMFYDEDISDACDNVTYQASTNNYYYAFNTIINGEDGGDFKGLKSWKKELTNKKDNYARTLSDCQLSYGRGRYGDGGLSENTYLNSPCKVDNGNGTYLVTLDPDATDEVDEAIGAIQSLIDNMQDFRTQSTHYYEDMNGIYDSFKVKGDKEKDFDYGGINPVTYRWRDSRCPTGLADTCDEDKDEETDEDYKCHSVTIETSRFKIPWIDEEKSGGFLSKKVCLVLTDYCYDPNGQLASLGTKECKNSYNPVWVKITRNDLGNQAINMLGSWNSKDTAQEEDTDLECDTAKEEETSAAVNAEACAAWKDKNPKFKIMRKSVAYFNYDKVGLAGIGSKQKK